MKLFSLMQKVSMLPTSALFYSFFFFVCQNIINCKMHATRYNGLLVKNLSTITGTPNICSIQQIFWFF